MKSNSAELVNMRSDPLHILTSDFQAEDLPPHGVSHQRFFFLSMVNQKLANQIVHLTPFSLQQRPHRAASLHSAWILRRASS